MENIIIVMVLVLLVGGACAYLVRAKRRGVKCVGCPAGGSCPGSQKVKKKKLKNRIIGQKTLEVSGMHCAHCVKSVTESLNALEGLTAEVDLEKGTAWVRMDRMVEDAVLVQAVEKAGFTVKAIRA